MSKVYIVTSFKGGVGKTTLSANLAMSLARHGHSVVAVDCDLESRCLDIILGLENSSLFNVCDVLRGDCTLDNALVEDERNENLHFIPAPAFYPDRTLADSDEMFSKEAVGKLVKDLSARFEYVIFDLPARPDYLYRNLALYADCAFIISLHTAASIRAAEKTAIALNQLTENGRQNLTSGGLDTRLIVNGFRIKDAKDGSNVGLYDIISKTRLQLEGVLPFDNTMCRAQEKGKLAYQAGGKRLFFNAVDNIARRCMGHKVPLFENVETKVKNNQVI